MDPLLAAAGHSSSPAWVMGLFGLIMLLTYVGVAYERFHKTVAALCGAAVLTALSLTLGVFAEYEAIHEHLARDLNVFGVIIGTGILVEVTGRSGLFHFLSMLIVRGTGGQVQLAVSGDLRFDICFRGPADDRARHADPRLAGAGHLRVAGLRPQAFLDFRRDRRQQWGHRHVCQRTSQHHDRHGCRNSLRSFSDGQRHRTP